MNPVFTHPGQPQMQAEVILASEHPEGTRPLITLRGRLPRCIWPEVLTHRDFSRNARSSRAVPIAKMIQEVRETPFVPWHWGKNQPGMQAGAELNTPIFLPDHGDIDFHGKVARYQVNRKEAWLSARDHVVDHAKAYADAGYHKQLVNRLLEPFMWIDVLISAVHWDNFFWLREHEAAEPHLQDWARLVCQALASAEIQKLESGGWHLPYIRWEDWECIPIHPGIEHTYEAYNALACKLSAARCARISYAPFDGDASYERELERFDSLVSSDRVHASPLEHQARPDWFHNCFSPLSGWKNPELHANTPGWIQHRKMIPGEVIR